MCISYKAKFTGKSSDNSCKQGKFHFGVSGRGEWTIYTYIEGASSLSLPVRDWAIGSDPITKKDGLARKKKIFRHERLREFPISSLSIKK